MVGLVGWKDLVLVRIDLAVLVGLVAWKYLEGPRNLVLLKDLVGMGHALL
jgi:hypothetical protein